MIKPLAAFIGLCLAGQAHADKSDWLVVAANDKSGDYIAATVADNDKDFLAYRCFKELQLCSIALRSTIKCEDKAKYPMLVNSDSGSFAIEGTCTLNKGNYEHILTPYIQIRDVLVKGEGIFGIAIPMASGEFKAIRFKLRGASEAMLEVTAKTKKLGDSKLSDTF
jgi:hypothetical protein